MSGPVGISSRNWYYAFENDTGGPVRRTDVIPMIPDLVGVPETLADWTGAPLD